MGLRVADLPALRTHWGLWMPSSPLRILGAPCLNSSLKLGVNWLSRFFSRIRCHFSQQINHLWSQRIRHNECLDWLNLSWVCLTSYWDAGHQCWSDQGTSSECPTYYGGLWTRRKPPKLQHDYTWIVVVWSREVRSSFPILPSTFRLHTIFHLLWGVRWPGIKVGWARNTVRRWPL